MSDYTEHYNLKKPLKTENYDVDVANTNNDIIDEKIYNKVDKISGKDLSTNDFTNEYKKKIDRIIEGTKGDSAYQIAVKNGFEGTEKKWLESLKGDKGDKGELVDLIKEEEGKNISIESANLPAIEVRIEGESRQATRSGKNYFDASQIPSSTNIGVSNNGKTITMPIATSGDGITNTYKKLSELCPKLKVGDIVALRFSRNLGNTYNNFIYLSEVSLVWGMNASKTITQEMLDSNVALYANRYNNGETGQCILTDFSIMLSSETDTSWEPYGASPSRDYPSPIENIEGNIEIKDEGKNLYAGNEITINGTYSSNTSVNLGSRYLSEGTYTISLTNSLPNNCYIYLGANGSIAYAIKDKATFTLTKEQNVPIRLIVKAGTYSNFTTKIMIEKGIESKKGYEPHKSQTEYFSLLEGQKLYKGSYLADDGIHPKRNQVVLNGTETGWYTLAGQTGTNTSCFAIAKSDMKKASILICDKFINRATWNTDEEAIQSVIDNYIRLRINTSRASTVAELRTWLSNNPITVEYELAEEEIIPYTEDQKEAWEKIKNMILYKGTNNISCTGKLKIKYYTNEEMNEIYSKKEDLHEHANKSILDQTQEAFTTELKNKLDGLNNYVLPAPTSTTLGGVKAGANITIDTDGTINAQLGSGGETSANNYEDLSNKPQIAGITLQGNKSLADLGIQGIETGKGLSSNDYSTTEKAKLAGVEAQANKYIHPSTSGNKHIPSGGSTGQILKWLADGTAVWGADHTVATTSTDGLMSKTDKTKLNNIAEGANKYVHPTTSGNKHIPSGGSSGQVLKWQSDGMAKWDSLSSSGELGTDNLNTKKISGIYAQSTATNFLKSRNYPFDHADGFPFFDILLEVKNAGMYIMQELHLSYRISVQGQEVISYFTYMRFSTNNGSTWSAWRGHEGTTTQ